jgi:hypothetical protein
MIPKSGSRFSEKIMLKREMAACMPWRLPGGKGGQARSRTAASAPFPKFVIHLSTL